MCTKLVELQRFSYLQYGNKEASKLIYDVSDMPPTKCKVNVKNVLFTSYKTALAAKGNTTKTLLSNYLKLVLSKEQFSFY